MAVEILVTSFTFPFSLETSINRRKEKKKGLDRVNDRFDVARAKERRITTRIEQRYLSRYYNRDKKQKERIHKVDRIRFCS